MFAVLIKKCVHDLVEETQRVDFSDGHRLFVFFRAYRVDLGGKFPDCPEIRENHIAVIREQFIGKIIMFSGFARNVEFHIYTPLCCFVVIGRLLKMLSI